MPDILISFIPVGQKQLDHKIAIELKAAKPWRSYSIDHLSNRNIHKDFKILNILKQNNVVNYSYFFYLYSHETKKEYDVRKQILNSRFKVNKKNTAKKKYFKPLVINRFLDPKTKKITNDIDERKEKSRRIFRSYEGQDPRFSKNTKNDKKGSLQSKRMSLRAYKANLTRKKKNPKKFGRVTQDLLDNIKRLEKILNS